MSSTNDQKDTSPPGKKTLLFLALCLPYEFYADSELLSGNIDNTEYRDKEDISDSVCDVFHGSSITVEQTHRVLDAGIAFAVMSSETLALMSKDKHDRSQ